MTNLPAKAESRPITLRDRVEAMGPEFRKALPGHIPMERFVRTAQTAIQMTRNIDKVTDPRSLLAACTNAAQDGLILDGREAALVVDYKGEAQYRPMMRGLLKLAYNSGAIKTITVEVARENDTFIYSPTREEPITHEIDLRKPRGEVFAVYALAYMKDGGVMHEVMSREDIEGIMERSDAYRAFKAGKIKSTPWSTDWSEMARKTVFRRLSKYLPSSTDRDDFQRAVERIDEDYDFDASNGGPATPAATPTKKRGAAAAALRDVTPAPDTPAADPAPTDQDPGPQPDDRDHDPETGEIQDAEYSEMRPGDDI